MYKGGKTKKPSDERQHLVIVGAGFGGMALARKLRGDKRLKITLINDQTTFRYSPALYRAAIGYRRRQAIIPLKEIVGDCRNLSFKKATVVSIDRKDKVLTTSENQKINYDYAVLSMGVVTNYFGIPGLDKYSFGIKTPQTLDSFHAHLHSDLAHNHKPDRNYVVVGAGPTGSELSAGLVTYLKKIIKKHGMSNKLVNIELIERADRVLPTMTPKASEAVTKRLRKLGVRILLGEAVMGETEHTLKLADRTLSTQTVVWTAGTANNPFYKDNAEQFEINERGKVVVNEYFEIDPSHYVIGDNIEGNFSGLAESAVKHAHYTAKHLKRKLSGKTQKPYKAAQPIYVVPIGKHWAVMNWRGKTFSGLWVAVVRSAADLIGYKDVMGWPRAIGVWLKSDETEEKCRICKQPTHMDLNE